jgi:hypothetical protein
VNVTGRWFLEADILGLPGTRVVDFEQRASALIARDPVTSFVVFSGTIDSRPSGACWQADFDATGVVKNTPGTFKARSR